MSGFDAQPYMTVPTLNAALTLVLTLRLIQQMLASSPPIRALRRPRSGCGRGRTRCAPSA
jgi:hypothetical protein